MTDKSDAQESEIQSTQQSLCLKVAAPTSDVTAASAASAAASAASAAATAAAAAAAAASAASIAAARAAEAAAAAAEAASMAAAATSGPSVQIPPSPTINSVFKHTRKTDRRIRLSSGTKKIRRACSAADCYKPSLGPRFNHMCKIHRVSPNNLKKTSGTKQPSYPERILARQKSKGANDARMEEEMESPRFVDCWIDV